MKNFFSILFAFALIVLCSYTTRPMFGVTPNTDNTGRSVTYGAMTISDTLGSTIDTILIVPSNQERYYTLNLKDSCVISVRNTGSSYPYSKMYFIINNTLASTGKVKFLGYSGLSNQWLTNTTGTSTFSVTASRSATIGFVCTGTKYAEMFRSQD